MHPRLQPTYDALERATTNLLSQLAGLTDEQLHHRPDESTWSLAGLVEHLALVESGTTSSLAQGLPEAKRKPRLRQRLLGPLLPTILRLPVRVPTPTPQVDPAPDVRWDDAAEHWRAVRADLARELARFGDGDMATPVFLHPIAGPLTPPRTVGFLNDHLAHHMHQVKRLREHRDFPTG